MPRPSSAAPRHAHAGLTRAVLAAAIAALLPAAPLFADDPDAIARRFVTLAYEGRFDQLPKAPGADTERFERRVRHVLRVRCVVVEGMTVSTAAARENEAVVEIEVAIAKSDSETPAAWSEMEVVPLRIHLVPADEGWVVSAVRNRDEELAELLLSARSGDRERVLAEHRSRVSRGVVRAIYDRALALLNKGDFEKAADALQLTGAIAAEAGDAGGAAMAVATSNYTGKASDASALLSTGQLLEGMTEPDVLARLWYDRGRFVSRDYWEARDPRQVARRIEAYQTALRHAARAEDPTVMVRTLYSLGNLLANALSDHLTARRYIDQGITVAREIGDEVGEMSCETVLATIYFEQEDHERGLFHHGRALALAEKLQAYGYPSLLIRNGLALARNGQFQEAAAAFDRVLTRNANGVAVRFGRVPRPIIGSALRSWALVEAESGDLSEAECLMRESAAHFEASHAFLFDLAQFDMRRGDAAAALSRSLASLTDSSRFSSGQKVGALLAASRAYGALGQPEPALETVLEAIEIAETIDSRTAGDERQHAQASRVLSECYGHAAELAVDENDAPGALAFLENGRARVLTQIVDHGRPGAMAEADAQLDEEQALLERELVRISVELDRARVAGQRQAAVRLNEQLRVARAAHASFVDGRRARSERSRASRRQLDRAAILEMAARLPPGVAAVEYLVAPRRLHLFVISNDPSRGPAVTLRTVDVDQDALDRRARALVRMLADRDLRVEAAARELYELLIGPIEAELAGRRAVILVPDKVLWRVPFAALIDGRGQYLVERLAVVYAPSLGAYAAASDAPAERKGEPASLLAIGNPSFDSSAGHTLVSHYRDVTLGSLPDAEHEADAVGRLYGAPAVILKRGEATEARVKSALPEATVVHFATHAILDDTNPMYSRLALAAGTAEEDGWLESWEVARLRLRADIVVLSACDTARGRVAGGEGVIGMTWAFFVAGARSTVATHWKIPSSSTADLMIGFHRLLRSSPAQSTVPRAEALRQAQLALLRDKRTRHPFHWAGFILMGKP